MSAHIHTAVNIQDLARKLGRHTGQLFGDDAGSYRLDLAKPAEANAKLARGLRWDVLDTKHGKTRNDSERHDAATAFTTSALSTVLAPVFIQSSKSFLFAPGFTGPRGQLLPIKQTVELGKQQVEYPVVVFTGEARRMASGSTKDLPRVGTSDDMKSQRVGLYGVRFGWDEFELWQSAHLGRQVQNEQQRAASMAMAEYFEDFCSYGDLDTQRPGFFNHGSCFTIDIATNLGTSTSATDILDALSYIDIAWDKANPNRILSGVIMPKVHAANMKKRFLGASSEGQSLWKVAVEFYPWLGNIITDDRLLTASQSSGAMWQFWSADGEDQYIEATPSPLLYGPFNDELETTFIMIGQTAGVINKDSTAIMRVNVA
jgi:hypothetical protein